MEMSDLDRKLYLMAVKKLNKKFNTVEDLRKFWNLFGHWPYQYPEVEVRRPWDSGLGHSS